MAYDDYLNKDAFRGGVLDAPDLQVRTAQAKIAAGAAHLLTSKEWQRIANRQMLEQQSAAIRMTGPQQASQARAAMNTARPRFTAQELFEANQPGTVQIPEELRIRNIPGRGEMTVVNGTEIRGGPPTQGMATLPVPEEGYGYIQGKNDYLSTTPYGMVRGATPVLGDTLATETPPVPQQPAIAPAPQSYFEQQVAAPASVPMTGMRPMEQPVPSLQETLAKPYNAAAGVMRGTLYSATNLGGIASGLSSLIQDAYGKPPAPSPTSQTPAMTTDILGISQVSKPRVTPDVVAKSLLSGFKPPMPQQPSAAAPSPVPEAAPMVRAVIPEGVTGQTELAPQFVEQPVAQPVQAAPSLPVYRPPQFKAQPFDAGQMMRQPSVSETLGMAPALRAYQAQTKAQIDAYKANVTAQRNAFKDSIDAQLKGVDLQKKQADVLSAQLANSFTTGGPTSGIANVGGKAVGYIQTGPQSVRIIDLESKKSGAEANYEFRLKANDEIARRIQAGDKQGAAIMYQSLGGLPENFNLFAQQFESVPDPKVTGQGQKLTTEQAKAFLSEAGGDKAKARKLATERGFTF